MKVLLTGATGFVGGETLQHLVAHPAITHVTCLSRREISLQSSKVTTLLHSDFEHYDGMLLNRLAHHSACFWTLGSKSADVDDIELLQRVTHTYTLALARGLAEHLTKPFTFCYLSGRGADPTETSFFPWEKATRHLKGRTEKDLLALQEHYQDFSVHCFRPGGILAREHTSSFISCLLAPLTIGVSDLADGMIKAALDPGLRRHRPLFLNKDIKQLAQS